MSNKFVSIKEKLITSYLLILIILIWVSGYSLYTINRISNEYNVFIEKINILNQVKNEIKSSKVSLDNLLLTRSTNYIDPIYTSIGNARFDIGNFKELKLLSSSYNEASDIQKLIESYEKYSEKTFRIALGTADERYIQNYKEANRVYSYIIDSLEDLIQDIFDGSIEGYEVIVAHNARFSKVIIFIFGLSLIMSVGFIILFSMTLIKRVNLITKHSKELSKGNFDTENLPTDGNDEISLLSDSFNMMVKKIRTLMKEVTTRTILEKEAQFKALQSQINPHFLFNTLNIIAKTSILEGADKTCDLIESLSDILRYTLQNPSSHVSIGSELKNLREYVYIQKSRFGDRVSFIEDIDESLLHYKIPLLSIQPFIENSFKYGLEGIEEDSFIRFSIRGYKNYIVMEIKDKGRGFCDSKIASSSTGIGMQNVSQRLSLMFKNKSRVFFYNWNEGAIVKIIIPKVE